ncbi:TLC domain-containing protein 5-like [Schistocerca americana]|uniref:TLC domain-containing protein 5-like n=1 Tax=Schistocerca americana TaxID=7009 RepID=UPI001F4FA5EE|nr:TLC domain-containing protein 5-like [Schistocerca americana]XP_047119182.1 TLC domain-containing protein 5-like [Schistocerca piceifrons]XP_049763823.1 TLC domain-containing protein 5-like [Schistocerca cancellata]XP_049789399.1 TLC domain-containing protein 5-like isoform X1 [Schistocerca nitens]
MLSSWTVLATATVWTALYHGIRYQFKLDPEWSCRLLTAFHATLVTVLAVLACFLGPWPFTDPGGPNTTLQCVVLVTSLGYFIFDFIWCLYHQTEGATMLIHHAVSIIAISRVLMKGVSGTEAVAGVGGLEITNPLLQARWFLRSSGYKGTVVFYLTEITFMLTFFAMRIILGSYLFFAVVSHPQPDFESKVYCTAFYVLSWVFMIYILQYFRMKYVIKSK